VKRVILLPSALKLLRRYRSDAPRILAKVEAYAEDAASQANNVKTMKGGQGLRLRVGEFRVIFEETSDEIIVTKIGPRGGIYD
jgi:mRNA interferase RelE/StbE